MKHLYEMSIVFLPKYYSPYLWLLLWGLCACGKETESNEPTVAVKQYKVAQVKRKAIRFPVRTSGHAALDQEVSLSFKIGGIIERIPAQKGDRVSQGQILATLDKTEIQERLAQAQENYERLKTKLARTEKLYAQNIGTLQELDELRAAFKIAESDLDIAKQALRDANLYAPNTGIILEKFQETGEIASPGKPVFRMSGLGQGYIFKASLADDQVVKVQTGDSAIIHFSAYPNRALTGKISLVSTLPNAATGLYEVEIVFDNQGINLKPGFIGDVLIFSKREESFAFIPPEALIEADKYEALVYIRSPKDSLSTRKVKIAHILDREIAISEGLENIKEVVIP